MRGIWISAYALIFMASAPAAPAVAEPQNAKAPNDKMMEAAKGGITEKLKDPNSAMFRNLSVHKGDKPEDGTFFVCGEVNSKNSYGGYAGYKPFAALVFYYEKQAVALFGTGMVWEDQTNPAPGALLATQCSN